MKPRLYLASQSPRRRQLLEQLGVASQPLEVDIDEDWRPPETAQRSACAILSFFDSPMTSTKPRHSR